MRSEIARHLDHDPHFAWRGHSVTRIENLSDIVFALALGMLLLTGTPPQTYDELVSFLFSIVPVAAGFAILFMIWNAHFIFFRRYGLADTKIVFLNSVLLLLVLFIAYPLRFIFESLFGYIIGSLTSDWQRLIESNMLIENAANSMAIFAGGFAMIITLISLMYSHAMTKSEALCLSEAEKVLTLRNAWMYRGEAMIAVLVLVCALFTPLGPFSGVLMGLMGLNAMFWKSRFKPTLETNLKSGGSAAPVGTSEK